MPNTEVKLINAESTWPEAAREDRKLLIKKLLRRLAWEFFCVCECELGGCVSLLWHKVLETSDIRRSDVRMSGACLDFWLRRKKVRS